MSESVKSTLRTVMYIGGLVLAASFIGIFLLFYSQSVTTYQQTSDVEKLCGLLERSSIELELRLVKDTETNELLVVDCDKYSN